MLEFQNSLKMQLKILGKLQVDIQRALEMDYNRLNRWFNGTLNISQLEIEKITELVNHWHRKKNAQGMENVSERIV